MGEWRGLVNAVITHIDMLSPRVQTLKGTQLAWSPGTAKKGVTAELVLLPTVADSNESYKWLPSVTENCYDSMKEPTGRPELQLEEFATPESLLQK